MKPVDVPQALQAETLPAEAIAAARLEARASGTRVVEALEAIVALAPAEFTRRLAATVRFPALSMDDLHRLQAAFDVLPFADAMQHECMALREP